MSSIKYFGKNHDMFTYIRYMRDGSTKEITGSVRSRNKRIEKEKANNRANKGDRQ